MGARGLASLIAKIIGPFRTRPPRRQSIVRNVVGAQGRHVWILPTIEPRSSRRPQRIPPLRLSRQALSIDYGAAASERRA
jgi:hypothetical protein